MTDIDVPADPKSSQPWLDRLESAERVFDGWQTTADNIDKLYSDLGELGKARDREFALFWSNIQVMGPAIYARPPVPVVTPKFKDRRPLYRTSSEMLERACVVSFDLSDIDDTMIAMRDDLAIVGRGAAWVRYEDDGDVERVCYEHVDRKDFLHEPARKWSEVDWVARRAWMTKDEMRERFGDVADDLSYEVGDGKRGYLTDEQTCGVWEAWCKSKNRVIWVTDGHPETLDEDEPHLKLDGFFPCPPPAYSTVQRRSLIPVPDVVYYKDQLEEVNDLTRRIHTLADAIKVRGFYAGGGDVGAAIETAIRMEDDSQVLVPVPGMQALMQGGGEPIMWLPLDQISQTITGLIELRRQVIDDVYQIIGLSDIMRGSTEASETLGAQRLKQQNGSARVRDKQNELVRMARDLVRIGAEIMAEEFSEKTLIEMAQMDLPTNAGVKSKIKDIEKAARDELKALAEQVKGAAEQAAQSGQAFDQQQAEQQFNEQQQQIIAKWQPEIQKLSNAVTIEQVMEFLKDEKLRPFVLDIETDSTIYPDELAEKQSRQEFMAAFSASMAALQPMFQMGPEAIGVAGGVFKFALSPYRVGRELEGLIDDFVDQAPSIAERLQEDTSEDSDLADAQMALAQAEMRKAEAQGEKVQADAALKVQELQLRAQEAEAKAQEAQQKFALEIQDSQTSIAETEARIEKIKAEILAMMQKAEIESRAADRDDAKAASDIQSKDFNQAVTVYEKERDALGGGDQ